VSTHFSKGILMNRCLSDCGLFSGADGKNKHTELSKYKSTIC